MQFKKPYEILEQIMRAEIGNGDSVLDIGSNAGTIARIIDKYKQGCLVHCVDIDKEALNNLNENNFETTKVKSYCVHANEFLNVSSLNELDVIVINSTLHEINNPLNQREYMSDFFGLCKQMLKPVGKIIIGDYYYPAYVSDEDVAKYRDKQIREINHADSREKFVEPSLIWESALESQLHVVKQVEIPATRDIDRRYYNLIIRSEKDGS